MRALHSFSRALTSADACRPSTSLAPATQVLAQDAAQQHSPTVHRHALPQAAAWATSGSHHHTHVHLHMPPAGAGAGPSPSLIPFLFGCSFGALGLTLWQHVQADSRGMPPPPPHAILPSPSRPLPYPAALTGSMQGTAAQGLTIPNQETQPLTSAATHQTQPWHQLQGPGCTQPAPHIQHLHMHPHPSSTPSSAISNSSGPWQLVSWPWRGLWDTGGGGGKAGAFTTSGPAQPRGRPTSANDIHPATLQGVTPEPPAAAAALTAATRGVSAPVCPAAERPPLALMCSDTAVRDGSGGGSDDGAWSAPLTRGSISCASAAVAPAVVHIVLAPEGVAATAGPTSHAARYRSSSGSGFIYHPSGYILTNAHVVAPMVATTAATVLDSAAGGGLGGASMAATGSGQGQTQLSITMHDGRVVRGRVVALDRVSDVAVVKAEVGADEQLPCVQIGRSSRLRVGEWVVALGTPLMLKQSVTAGIVSCVERRGSEMGLEGARTAYIQTDAAVNQGNSGGPLVNLDGQVVGMSVFKAVAADGVSFAVPMDTVCEVVRHFHDHGRVIRPYVGVTLVEVTNGALKKLQQQVPQLAHAKAAVVIQAVREGSPAQQAGLEPEDIVFSLDGHEGLSMAEVVEAFGRSVNKPVTAGVIRQLSGGPPAVLTKQLTPREAGG